MGAGAGDAGEACHGGRGTDVQAASSTRGASISAPVGV